MTAKKKAAKAPRPKAKKAVKPPAKKARAKREPWDGPVQPPPEKPKPKKPEKKPRESSAERLMRERREAFARAAAAPDNTGEEQGGPEHLRATQFKPGQSGNPAGRPKGSRNKLGEVFLEDLLGAWERHGKAAIEMAMVESPLGFVKVVGAAIPKELNLKLGDFEEASDEDLDAFINQGLAAIGRATATRGGNPGEAEAAGAEQAGELPASP